MSNTDLEHCPEPTHTGRAHAFGRLQEVARLLTLYRDGLITYVDVCQQLAPLVGVAAEDLELRVTGTTVDGGQRVRYAKAVIHD